MSGGKIDLNGKMRSVMLSAVVALAFCITLPLAAQRRITPVENPAAPVRKKTKPVEFDRTRLDERRDASGRIVLVDTVTGMEYVDSTAVAKKPGNIYPLLHAVTVGVDFLDPLLMAFGQEYGGISAWGEISLHNRFKPYVEMGLSSASISPDGMKYTFSSPLAPFFKIGINYNVFYNSDPDYQLCVGIRYGFSLFRFTIEDVTTSDGDYWGETVPVSFPTQSTTAGFLEFALSIKVKIVRNISLGWTLKYHTAYGGNTDIGESMYIPGYGKRNNRLAAGFSVMYTIPLNKKMLPVVENK